MPSTLLLSLWLYLLLGACVAVRLVPWGLRTFSVSWIFPTLAASRVVGHLLAFGLVALAWPCYVWLWWRRRCSA